MKVLVSGRVTVYEVRGVYQLYAVSMRPAGAGELQMAFEALKQKLTDEAEKLRFELNVTLPNEIRKAVELGEWRAQAPSHGVAGFWISELYSPWKTLSEIVLDYLTKKDNPEELKVFLNTSLAENWIEKGDKRVSKAEVKSNWWRTFKDPTLDRLVNLASDENLQVQIAGLRILEARPGAT